MYFALDSYIKKIRLSILVCPLILCHLDICRCHNPFYTLCIFNYALNTIFKFLETFMIHCKLPKDISYIVYCFLGFNKDLVTWILDFRL